MTTPTRTETQYAAQNCLQPTRIQKAALGFVAFLVSSTLLCSMLGLFEMRSEETALARAATKTQPPINGLADFATKRAARS